MKSVQCSVVLFVALLSWHCKLSQSASAILDQLSTIKSKTSEEDQVEAVHNLLTRMFETRSNEFVLTVNKTYFELKNNMDGFEYTSQHDGKINIKATGGVALAAGVYHFLKYSCKVHVSWSGDQLNLPNPLPRVTENVRINFLDRFRYYQNVCTVSYSMVFWDWARWEKEIDWMALNGINFPLAFTAQETIWQMVYKQLGLTQEELDEHFSGPAFFAWQRMGNLDSWGGPLPNGWYQQQLQLQQKILKRMRSFGMIPVLPGFAGHIPKALVTRLYPHANYTKASWMGFPATFLLNPLDPLFNRIGMMFIEKQGEVYNGTDHVYNADVFNEMDPPSLKAEYMYNISAAIYSSMKGADPDAIWLLQGWFLLRPYWNSTLVKAWLQGVPLGKLIILDLASELFPMYGKHEGYYGHPFVWCMIENFGGNTRIYGASNVVMQGVLHARSKYPEMIGTGTTPEGINQNDINFDLMYEMAWRASPFNITEYAMQYLERRYGQTNPQMQYAWAVLMKTIYNASNVHNGGGSQGRVTVTRPLVKDKLNTVMWYDPSEVFQALGHMVDGARSMHVTDTLRHDVVKVGVQVLEDFLMVVYENLIQAFHNGSKKDLMKYSGLLEGTLYDMDELLGTDPYSLLGNWLESAKSMGGSETEKRNLEFNARNQITLWGPNGQISEYANKNWAGLVKGYYAVRWRMFTLELYDCLDKGRVYNQTAFSADLRKFEKSWGLDTTTFVTQSTGDVMFISEYLYHKYSQLYIDHQHQTDKIWKRAREHTERMKGWEFLARKYWNINLDVS